MLALRPAAGVIILAFLKGLPYGMVPANFRRDRVKSMCCIALSVAKRKAGLQPEKIQGY